MSTVYYRYLHMFRFFGLNLSFSFDCIIILVEQEKNSFRTMFDNSVENG